MKLNTSFKERKSLGQDVFEYLKNAIIDQTIEPGSRLVESKLAEMLGISRTPLREALHKLEREEWIGEQGDISDVPRRGENHGPENYYSKTREQNKRRSGPGRNFFSGVHGSCLIAACFNFIICILFSSFF